MSKLVLYVVAGPNGIGKTTSAFDLYPKGLPVINSDEIAKQLRMSSSVSVNTQEYSNREAQRLLQTYLDKRISFGIETNLADEETWKFLKAIRQTGYAVHLVYLSTDDLALLHQRIKERALRGEHFVRPDIVEERYFTGLKLLSHYFPVPDEIDLLDNSISLRRIAQKRGDGLAVIASSPPKWFIDYLLPHFSPPTKEVSAKDLPSVDDVRNRYRNQKGKP